MMGGGGEKDEKWVWYLALYMGGLVRVGWTNAAGSGPGQKP